MFHASRTTINVFPFKGQLPEKKLSKLPTTYKKKGHVSLCDGVTDKREKVSCKAPHLNVSECLNAKQHYCCGNVVFHLRILRYDTLQLELFVKGAELQD